jgi:hypothetical protein
VQPGLMESDAREHEARPRLAEAARALLAV